MTNKVKMCNLQLITYKITLLLALLYIAGFTFFIPTQAVTNPLSVANNKFGIHLIQATPDEVGPAFELVNSSGGDWGYVTVLIEQKDKKKDKWQNFFDDLRRKHLIPIVRLATSPSGQTWNIPTAGEENSWADFLNSLSWPVKNRYVVIYNEPNHGNEWGGTADPKSYARTLDKTITALKNKSPDFFVLNAGFDASTPNQPPSYLDEASFLLSMEQEVPGIFNKLDGWASHSYPNPNFAGSPYSSGKGTVRTWEWELGYLQSIGLTKALPVFITETGWQHAEGVVYDSTRITSETAGKYLKAAFEGAWGSPQVVAVTPFVLSYLDYPFDHFSFKRPSDKTISAPIIDELTSKYYPQYQIVKELGKTAGKPVQVNKAELIDGQIPNTLVTNESYSFKFKFKNTGGSIWDSQNTKLVLNGIDADPAALPSGQKVEPGQVGTFTISVKTPQSGSYELTLQLYTSNTEFETKPYAYRVEIKSAVVLVIHSLLGLKDDPSGTYYLEVSSGSNKTTTQVNLNSSGDSAQLEARYLLPDYAFDFTLSRPYYKSKTLNQTVHSGVNNLYFDKLDPNFLSALFSPADLWKLLPWSR